ncbi:C1 family peptidase [Changchengzhania lutea]|uniref:C1 family peptidase n=1 Tax=Changchengzhania lutea TaxID=2049305 RepID=UPI00115D813E|nr:C1 family peptidase [Changchengzhania lutea]
MKNNIAFLLLMITCFIGNSQAYKFETIVDLEATDVISQGKTGTCWSFSTSSFLESEIIRLTGKRIDLSEMFTVRNTYPTKAWNYVMRQGKAQFSEGGLAHDVMNSLSEYGLVPNSIYSGLQDGTTSHNHSKLIDTLKTVLDLYIKNPHEYTSNWSTDFDAILDGFLGKNITTFEYEGVVYTPKTFLEMTQLNPDEYVTITSFSHVPFNSTFILNIPDNFSNGSYYNVPLDDMVQITNHALKSGYTVELDCDVSEKTFSAKAGLAIIPENDLNVSPALTSISNEKEITQEFRQKEFENFNTTDDHLMHITGLVKDQNGIMYYKVKNSWGSNSERVARGGYLYMSEAYFRLKTISIMIHNSAVLKN